MKRSCGNGQAPTCLTLTHSVIADMWPFPVGEVLDIELNILIWGNRGSEKGSDLSKGLTVSWCPACLLSSAQRTSHLIRLFCRISSLLALSPQKVLL